MKKFINSLYGKISVVFLVLLLIVGVVQILISINSSLNFVRESDQQLNRNLAQDLANEFKPFLKDSLDTEGIKHTIHHLMVMNPRVEIYLLDEVGTQSSLRRLTKWSPQCNCYVMGTAITKFRHDRFAAVLTKTTTNKVVPKLRVDFVKRKIFLRTNKSPDSATIRSGSLLRCSILDSRSSLI